MVSRAQLTQNPYPFGSSQWHDWNSRYGWNSRAGGGTGAGGVGGTARQQDQLRGQVGGGAARAPVTRKIIQTKNPHPIGSKEWGEWNDKHGLNNLNIALGQGNLVGRRPGNVGFGPVGGGSHMGDDGTTPTFDDEITVTGDPDLKPRTLDFRERAPVRAACSSLTCLADDTTPTEGMPRETRTSSWMRCPSSPVGGR